MRLCLPLLASLIYSPILLNAQTARVEILGTQGGIVRPAGDATLSNIVFGSGVTPDGKLRYTKDVWTVQPGSGAVRQLTNFVNSASSPGATAVSIAPDSSTAAYLAILDNAGKQSQEVHVVDLVSGSDRLIATDTQGCIQPLCANCILPCLHDLHYSLDGKKLIWMSSQANPFFVANVDGSGVIRLPVAAGQLADSPNVVTADGRLVFLVVNSGSVTPYSIQLDGTGMTQLAYGPLTSDFIISQDGLTAAWQDANTVSSAQTLYSIQTANTSIATVNIASTPFSSLSISANGSQTASVHDHQVWTSHQITSFQFSDVLDAALNSAGTKILYSTAETNSAQRAAIWVADVSGANAKAIFGPGSINPGGIIGINSQGLPLALSPGSYFTIYGQNLHVQDELVTSNIPVTLQGTNGALPLQALTPWQVNAFLPMTTPSGPLTLTLALESGAQLTFAATVNQTAPALITYPDATGKQQAAAFHLSTLIPCDARNPARANEVVETYGFGLGITTPIQAVGVPAPFSPLARTVVVPTVTVGTQKVQILYSGLVPSVIGVYQINIVTPALAPGDYALAWSTADQTPVSQGNISIR